MTGTAGVGIALTLEDAIDRTILALAANDGLELVLVAPNLAVPARPPVTTPTYKTVATQTFTARQVTDWNNLSLRPLVRVGDTLITTTESWSGREPVKFAYLVRQSETGWVVLARQKFRARPG